MEAFFQLKSEEEAERFGAWWSLHLPLVVGAHERHETECQHLLGAKTGPSRQPARKGEPGSYNFTELNLAITRMTLETESSQHLLITAQPGRHLDFALVKPRAEKPADQLDFYPVS